MHYKEIYVCYFDIVYADFNALLPDLNQTVADADFFAIDTEFTGLQQRNFVNQFSTPSEYYAATNEHTKDYIVIQFGLTAFYVPKSGVDTADGLSAIQYKTFNFYLYPRAESQRFACQGGALAFLSSQNFDFNKLFRDGISFCDLDEAATLRGKQDVQNVIPDAQVAVPVAETKRLEKIRFEWPYVIC